MSKLWDFEWWMDGGPMPAWLDFSPPVKLPDDWDPNAPSPEWHATLPHEVVQYEEYSVPAYEGDTERIKWEREHSR